MDKQTILKGSNFSLDEESGVKFRLEYRNWNDYGFYTLYSLEMQLPDSNLSYRIADIHVMNIGQKAGENHPHQTHQYSSSLAQIVLNVSFSFYHRNNEQGLKIFLQSNMIVGVSNEKRRL